MKTVKLTDNLRTYLIFAIFMAVALVIVKILFGLLDINWSYLYAVLAALLTPPVFAFFFVAAYIAVQFLNKLKSAFMLYFLVPFTAAWIFIANDLLLADNSSLDILIAFASFAAGYIIVAIIFRLILLNNRKKAEA